MPDETYSLRIDDNLNDVAARAQNAKKAVDDLSASLDKTGSSSHTFPAPGQTIATNELGSQIEKISAAQDRWALSTMNHSERIQYFNTKVSQTVEGTDDWYNAQAQLNNEMKKSDDSLNQIARNFTPMIGAGRALSELGRAGSIFGNLFGSKDLQNIGMLTMAVGDLVMFAGRIPQTFGAATAAVASFRAVMVGTAATTTAAGTTGWLGSLGVASSTGAALAVAGTVAAAAATALAAAKIMDETNKNWMSQNKTSLYTNPSTPLGGTFQMGNVGKQALGFPDIGKALGLDTLGYQANATKNEVLSSADAIKVWGDRATKYTGALDDQIKEIDKLNEHDATVRAKSYADANKVANAVLGIFGVKDPFAYLQTVATNRASTQTPSGLFGTALTDRNMGAINQMLPTNAMDLTKSSQSEINTAKQVSVNLTRAEIQARVEQAAAMGATKEQQEALVKLLQDEVSKSLQLVNINGQLSYLKGEEAYRFSEAQSNIKASQPDFNFQRTELKSSQFPQLAALAAMYDAMLTKLGSPEKQTQNNLLMGDGSLKVLNVRMSALQMALEDLTKVEKAQLSGTWNLPAGATALVPISSLDIQRWNKDNSGLSADALRALMGATNGSGDKVSQSQQLAATRIIQALHENLWKSGLSTAGVDKSTSASDAIKAAGDTIRERFAQALMMRDTAMNAMSGKGFGALPDSISQQMKSQQITISALPIKANLTTSVSVMLNGMVVARAIMPFLFDLLARTTASSGYKKVGVTR